MKFKIFALFLITIFIQQPVHAYAGPGVAIGIVIVFLTLIFTFLASLLISSFELTKKVFFKIRNKLNKKQKKKINK